MSKHTPTPWHVANGNQIRSERDQIAKTWLMRGDEGQANAAHIARCVNSHDALVKALHVIKSQSVGADWTAEQALAFIKQHASEALAAAGAPQ